MSDSSHMDSSVHGDPMDCSTPGFPVLQYLPEFAQTQVHWVGDAIQPSYPLSPSSPPALNLSHHQDLFQWVCSSHHLAKRSSASVLPVNSQGWFPLGLTGLIFLQSKGLSRIFSNTRIWKHQFFGTQPSFWSNSHRCIWLLKKTIAFTIQLRQWQGTCYSHVVIWWIGD